MKKIDVIEDQENKTVVDDELLLEDNQDSSDRDSGNKTGDSAGKNGLKKEKDSEMKKPSKLLVVLTIVAVLAGVGTGFGTFKLSANSSDNVYNGQQIDQLPTEGQISNGDIFGSADESFKDSAEGYLEEGGIDGEGSHKLLRPGGESQTVYLTSSVTDLNQVVGMEVKIWGETFKGQKASWLMDVGRVEVLNVDAESPAEE